MLLFPYYKHKTSFFMLKRLLLISLPALFLLASCGEDSKHFKIEGRLLQINQGEFYLYSSDGTISGFDTIKVQGGRFSHEIECDHPTTLTLVFPNFSEQPIFAEPGKTVDIDGDASHLKMLKIKGTDDNELMSDFREQIAASSPPEIKRFAARFIEDHPQSPVSIYLVKKYFIITPRPDYREAARLLKLMKASQPDNFIINNMLRDTKVLGQSAVGTRLPAFKIKDMKGNTITSNSLSRGLVVICTWASWSYPSTDMLRQLHQIQIDKQKPFKVISICVDANKADCDTYLNVNEIKTPNVFTGEMFNTAPLKILGLQNVPDNIVVKDGKIVARSLDINSLREKVESLL
jgi:hypothetical protein